MVNLQKNYLQTNGHGMDAMTDKHIHLTLTAKFK